MVDSLTRFIVSVPDLVRWKEWYHSKIPFVFITLFTVTLADSIPVDIALPRLVVLLIFCCSYLAFGYLINDFSDKKIDQAAGKIKAIQNFSDSTILSLLVILFIIGSAMALVSISNTYLTILFLFVAYFFGFFYSMPPLRFKEKGVWGLVISSITQRVIPILLLGDLLTEQKIIFILFLLLFTLIGIRWILVHQLIDLENDLNQGVSTFVTKVGFPRTNILLRYVFFPLELICLGAILYLQIRMIPFFWIIPFLYGGVFVAKSLIWRGHGKPYLLDTFSRQPLEDFYYFYWPLGLAFLLTIHQPIYWIVLSLYIFWQSSFIIHQVKVLRNLIIRKHNNAIIKYG
ncbi:MAG: UbiA family prenyltransferase [Anaerolineaceae bacterium]|nr:UbiA family prenyltransferase [Anaerolineaceae bacterium]